jgi:hypothetical protein
MDKTEIRGQIKGDLIIVVPGVAGDGCGYGWKRDWKSA